MRMCAAGDGRHGAADGPHRQRALLLRLRNWVMCHPDDHVRDRQQRHSKVQVVNSNVPGAAAAAVCVMQRHSLQCGPNCICEEWIAEIMNPAGVEAS